MVSRQAPFFHPAFANTRAVEEEPLIEVVQRPGESLAEAFCRTMHQRNAWRDNPKLREHPLNPFAGAQWKPGELRPVIDMVNVDGVWMTIEDARDAAAARAPG